MCVRERVCGRDVPRTHKLTQPHSQFPLPTGPAPLPVQAQPGRPADETRQRQQDVEDGEWEKGEGERRAFDGCFCTFFSHPPTHTHTALAKPVLAKVREEVKKLEEDK